MVSNFRKCAFLLHMSRCIFSVAVCVHKVQCHHYKVFNHFRCTPLDEDHACYPLTARNSLDSYPQVIPGDVSISSTAITTGFSLLKVPPPDPNCETAFMHILCLAATPPCTNITDLLLPVCNDSCLAFNRLVEEGKCDSIIQSAEQFLMLSSLPEAQIFLDLLTGFNCNNASTYYYFDRLDSLIDSGRCTDLLTPQQTGT